jgi:outer membrane receptor protein involved in Fe transport
VFGALGVPLATFKSNVVNASVLGTTGGNQNLLNESANSWTAGFVARPHWIPGLTIALDWINIHLKNPITALTLTQVMDACFDAPSLSGNNFCTLFTRDKGGQVVNFSTPLANAGAQEFAGAQLDSVYTVPVGDLPLISHLGLTPGGDYGNLTFDLNGFFESKHNFQILGVVTNTLGNIGDSKWRFNASARYRKGPLMVYVNTRYVSKGDLDVTLQRTAQSVLTVDEYWVTNGAVSYDVNEHLTAEISVSNLFNQNPPRFAETLNANAALATYDYFGQAATFRLKARF